VITYIFLLLVLADIMAMAKASGSVRHHGRKGCQLLCGFVRWNKIQGSHYYPALLQPNGFKDHRTSLHPEVDVNSLPIPDPGIYKQDLHHVITSLTQREYKSVEVGCSKSV
jgi:hypothetical protein